MTIILIPVRIRTSYDLSSSLYVSQMRPPTNGDPDNYLDVVNCGLGIQSSGQKFKMGDVVSVLAHGKSEATLLGCCASKC